MAIRLTVILLVIIYVTMRFASGPIPQTPTPEIAAAPQPESQPQTAQAIAPAEDASPATQDSAASPVADGSAQNNQGTSSSEPSDRITLAPPPALSPAVEEAAEAALAAEEAAQIPPGAIIAPEVALPEGFAGGAGLGGALDLRDQVSAALDEAQDPPARPTLADLARPGGGQEIAPEATQDVAAVQNDDTPRAVVTAASVNLRGGPSTLNLVVGRVSNGEVLELRGEFSGGWAAVGHPETGETVYISQQFLDRIDN